MGKLEIKGVESEQAHKLERIWKLAEGQPYDATYVHPVHCRHGGKGPRPQGAWKMFEQIDDPRKTVDVRLQIKSNKIGVPG